MTSRLSDFERAAYGRQRENALAALIPLLREVEKGSALGPDDSVGLTATATRIASAISAVFSDPKLRLSQEGFERLMVFNRALNVVFAASAFDDSGHVMEAIAKRPKRPDEWRKYLAVATMDALRPQVVSALRTAPPAIALPGICGLLTGPSALTETAEVAREMLIGSGQRLRSATLTDPTVETLAITWMTCSYGHRSDKNDVKGHLNHLIERWLASRGTTTAATQSQPDSDRPRPRLLVCAERWRSEHAMFRCYGSTVRGLRERFEVVLLTDPKHVDDLSRQAVDAVLEIPFKAPSVEPYVDAVRKLAPDVILYPSLGMSIWTVCLANLRLAPLQLMMLGHPAPSRSRHIDYVLVEEGYEGDTDRFTEKVALLGKGAYRFVPVTAQVPPPQIQRSDEVVFAIPSYSYKLNSRFLDACRRIERESKKPVRFELFHNEVGFQHRRIERCVGRYLERVTVHRRSDYPTYLERLNRCDVHLGVFPFGGTNSNIDTMRLGLPIVSMRGTDSEETELLERAGVRPWQLADDEQAYVEAALRLVEDPELRCRLSERLADVDVDRLFMVDEAQSGHQVVDAVGWLYENHEALAGSDQRVYRMGQMAEGAGPSPAPNPPSEPRTSGAEAAVAEANI